MRKLLLYGVILIQIAIVISLVRGIQLSKRSAGRIALMQETKAKLEEERDKLQREKEYVESQFYLEKVARDELHLVKEGETVVIVSNERDLGEVESPKPNAEQEAGERTNWQKWWDVLSGTEWGWYFLNM